MTKPNHHVFADGELSRREDTLRLDKLDGEHTYLPIENIHTLYLHGQITFNTRVVGLLNDHAVPVHIFGWKDYYRGSILPKRKHVSGNTVVQQVRTYDEHEKRMEVCRQIIRASIHNMRSNLKYYDNRGHDFSGAIEQLQASHEDVGDTTDVNELRGIESTARKAYYSCFDSILREPFEFTGRNYNPPSNEVNALISYLNAMVYTTCVSAIRKTALDPSIGFVHEPGERRFSLSLDIADIFKPILADRVLFRLVNRQQVTPTDFDDQMEGCLLTEDGRMSVLQEYEKTLDRTVNHPRLKRKVSYKTLVQTDVYSLKKHVLTGEPYRPTERWW